jgi:hypothetical protein
VKISINIDYSCKVLKKKYFFNDFILSIVASLKSIFVEKWIL